MDDELNQMRSLVLRHAHGRQTRTPIPRVSIATGSMASRPMSTLYEPMLCLVLQGAKEVMIGDRLLRYDSASYFIASMELPASGRIVEASPDRPYIAVAMALDWEGLAALLPEVSVRAEAQGTAFGV